MNSEVLISLTCPKLCTKLFKGRHFVVMRILSPQLAKRFNVQLPKYSGCSQIVEL